MPLVQRRQQFPSAPLTALSDFCLHQLLPLDGRLMLCNPEPSGNSTLLSILLLLQAVLHPPCLILQPLQ